MSVGSQAVAGFEAFVHLEGERLRKVMCSRFGVDVGCDATDSALGWAWEHWERLGAMENPAGYLYRVAMTAARRSIRAGTRVRFPPEPIQEPPDAPLIDSDIGAALVTLSEDQRSAVLMVHVYGWTPTELAELTGVPASTTRSHLRRGLRKLRRTLEKGAAR